MNGALSTLDWVIIAGYLLISLAVGLVFTRRAGKSMAEYFISGRNLPWWIAGTSMVATSFASDTPLYVTGLVRNFGIYQNWEWWAFAAGGMLSVFVFSRLWRRAEVLTDVELTELRYSGRSAAALRAARALYFALPLHSITMAWAIFAMATFLRIVVGLSAEWAVVACVVLTLTYAVLSGFWGVVVTDLLQFVIAMVGAIVLCVVVVADVGGLGRLAAGAAGASEHGETVVRFFPPAPAAFAPGTWDFWSTPFVGFCIFVTVLWWANKNADGGNVVVQRMLASKDEKNSLLATLWFNVANYALRPWPWILVALASIVVLPNLPPERAEEAYPLMIKTYLPSGLLGLVVASFLGAFMSTIDTLLNLSASYAVNDVYRRFLVRDASERHYVLASRIASVFFMLLASVIALRAESVRGLFRFLLTFSSGVGLVYLLRWFWWRVNAWSEIAAMAASAILGTTFIFAAGPLGLKFPAPLFITVVGSTAVWVAVTFLTKPVSEERLVAFYRKVRPYGFWGPIAAKAGVAPARGLGRMLLAWAAGTVMVLAATLGIGKALLEGASQGTVYLAIAAAGAVVVVWEIVRMTGRRAAA